MREMTNKSIPLGSPNIDWQWLEGEHLIHISLTQGVSIGSYRWEVRYDGQSISGLPPEYYDRVSTITKDIITVYREEIAIRDRLLNLFIPTNSNVQRSLHVSRIGNTRSFIYSYPISSPSIDMEVRLQVMYEHCGRYSASGNLVILDNEGAVFGTLCNVKLSVGQTLDIQPLIETLHNTSLTLLDGIRDIRF
jgi:hypothetical protein